MGKWMKVVLMGVAGCCAAAGIFVWMTPPPPQPPVLPPPPETAALAAAVIDGKTGTIYADKNGISRIYPASTTKILTCIVALEEGRWLLDMDADAVVTQRAASQEETRLGLRPDLPISLREVIYGMMLVSGNDAAVAVAETVGGSYERFVEMMNEKCAAIGVFHSQFANPHGLTNPYHYTTARDMVKIARYAMGNPDFRAIVQEKTHDMYYRNGIYRVIKNRNEFLDSSYPGANGIKTGSTDAAGDCLVASAERNGRLMIAAVYDDDERFEDVKDWLDYGFAAAKAEEDYMQALADEPILYKKINQWLGREPDVPTKPF